jgi:hypothetical protein
MEARAKSRIDFVEVVHRHGDAAAGGVEDFVLDGLAVLADEFDRQLALAGELKSVARYWSPKA